MPDEGTSIRVSKATNGYIAVFEGGTTVVAETATKLANAIASAVSGEPVPAPRKRNKKTQG